MWPMASPSRSSLTPLLRYCVTDCVTRFEALRYALQRRGAALQLRYCITALQHWLSLPSPHKCRFEITRVRDRHPRVSPT
eukprot:6079820-Prymnesium_polylepis.1